MVKKKITEIEELEKKTNEINKEESILDLRKIYLNSEHSFSTKMFFTLFSTLIGFVYFLITTQTTSTENLLGIIVFGVLVLFIQLNQNSSNLKRMCNKMIKKIINSEGLEKYVIEKDTPWDKILVGLTGGYFLFVSLLILTKSLGWSLIFGVILGIVLFFSKANYNGKE